MNVTTEQSRCYLYNASNEFGWGECCEELGIVPKPIWIVVLLSLPIEAVVAASDIYATAAMYERKSDRTALILLGYNVVSLGLIAYEFDWGSCEASAAGAFECYQGVLFMFYNSTAALASMTLWMLIILRKFYPHWYRATRFLVFPNVFWRWFDKSNFPLRGTKEVVRIWFIISKATGLFWYNFVGMFVTLLFGGGSHVIPMVFAYPFVFFSLWFALAYAHSLRIGYVAKSKTRTVQATLLAICLFYPSALVVCVVFLAFLPLNALLALVTKRTYSLEVPPTQKDDSDRLQLVIEQGVSTKFTVEANLNDSLYDLKLVVLESLGDAKLETNDITLMYQGEVLLNDSYTLKEYQVEGGSSLTLSKNSEEEEEEQLCTKICDWLSACCEAVAEWCSSAKESLCEFLYACCCWLRWRRDKQFIEEGRLYKLEASTAFGEAKPQRGPALKKKPPAVPFTREPTEEAAVQPLGEPQGRRTKAINYIKDALRNLCLFDANGKVILFASATTFVTFTLSANYGILLYTGAPYLKTPLIDFYARRTEVWLECTVANFADFDAFGLLDFLGLAVGIVAALIQLADFLSTLV